MSIANLKMFINELRTTDKDQIYGVLLNDHGGACAIGTTLTDKKFDYDYSNTYENFCNWIGIKPTSELLNFVNISRIGNFKISGCIITMNDEMKLTFKEIADKLEYFYKTEIEEYDNQLLKKLEFEQKQLVGQQHGQ